MDLAQPRLALSATIGKMMEHHSADTSRWRRTMASVGDVIVKNPNILHGTSVFRGTRVPFQALLDYLKAGETLDEFLKDFPSVSRQDAITALEDARAALVGQLG